MPLCGGSCWACLCRCGSERSLWCLCRRREGEWLTQLLCSLWPSLELYHLPLRCCLVAVDCGSGKDSLLLFLLCGCLLETADTAASLPPHHWPTKRSWEGGVACGECVEAEDKQQRTGSAQTNKRMRLPLCLSLRPSRCGIQEVGLGDRSFIVT